MATAGLGRLRDADRRLAKESDEALGRRVDAVVTGIAGLLASHLRYEQIPSPRTIDPQEWYEQGERRRRHESETAARFFEMYGRETLDIAQALRKRNALTEQEYQSLVFTMQVAGGGYIHDLNRITALLVAGKRRLLAQDWMAGTVNLLSVSSVASGLPPDGPRSSLIWRLPAWSGARSAGTRQPEAWLCWPRFCLA